MSLFRPQSNQPSSGHASHQETLTQIRTRVLSIILPISALLGAVILIARMSRLLEADSWINIAAYVVGILGLLLMALAPRLPYLVRALFLLMVITVVALIALAQSGFSGSGLLLLFLLAPLAMILLGIRWSSVFSILSLVFLILIAFMIGVKAMPVPPLEAQINSSHIQDWISTLIVFAIISALLTIATRFLFEGLDKSLSTEHKSSEELKRQHMILEQNVAERTRDLQRYITRMRTANDISKAITSNLDPQPLLEQVVELLQQSFNLYYVGVFLVDESRKFAVLHTGSGEAGKTMLAQNHRLALSGTSMIGWAINNRQARIALDVDTEYVRFKNPVLPFTRSEMALPLISLDQVIGALSLQSSASNAFTDEDITILQNIADILAAALENAQLYKKAQESLLQANLSNRRFIDEAWGDVLQDSNSLQATFENKNLTGVPDQVYTIQIPMILRDQTLGFIQLELDQQALSDEEHAFVEALASQTAQALENARLLRSSARQVGREQLINRMSARFTTSSEVEGILSAAVQELGRLPLVQEASIFIKPQSEPMMTHSHTPNGNNGHGKN